MQICVFKQYVSWNDVRTKVIEALETTLEELDAPFHNIRSNMTYDYNCSAPTLSSFGKA